MKLFLKSFYVRLSAIFLILLIILGGVQVGITLQTWHHYYEEVEQRLNLNLAEDMARELEPLLKDSSDIANIGHAIHYMMVLNPKIEIYILNQQGKILAFFADPPKKVKAEYVSLAPLQDFLSDPHQIPILGEDPRHPNVKKPFSVAPLKIGQNIKGYLYIILGGELYDLAMNTVQQNFLAHTIIKGLIITLIFTGLIGLIIFFFLTRRLHEMNEIVKSFEKGELDKRVPVKSADELGQLANSFNRMAETIIANIDELKNTDKLRRELIANVSHDLRTPLASIKGYLETIQIKGQRINNQEREQYIQIIMEAAEGMQKMVEQLFELSKLEAKQIKPHFEPFLIKDLIYDVAGKFKPVSEKKGIELKISVPDDLPQVYADIALIERALSNLISNALDYTERGGRVTIGVKNGNGGLQVLVEDTGKGIAEKDLPFIFERFYRTPDRPARNSRGAGLGLAITKKILEVHNSNIKVESKYGKGSKFIFDVKVWYAGRQPSFQM